MTAIVLFVELKLGAGQREAFLARARQHRDRVLANEPGCLRFDVSVPDGTDDEVRLYEVYKDRAAVDHHMGTDYMAAYRSDTAQWVVDRKIAEAVLAHD